MESMNTVWPRLVIRIAFKHSKVAIFHEEFEAGTGTILAPKARRSCSLLKYDPEQPRVPAGSGRESGQWTSDGNTSETQSPQTATPATSNNVQVAQNMKCSAFIAQNCKGLIKRESPSEYLDLSVDQLLQDAQGGVQTVAYAVDARQSGLACSASSWHSYECSRVGLLSLWCFANPTNLSFSP